MIFKAPVRIQDSWGSGEYGASRDGGKRIHKGVDLAAWPDSELLSPVAGIVSKLGYIYADDLKWRYVQVTSDGMDFRFFYILPVVQVGQAVQVDDVLGKVQDLDSKFKGITPHVHFEIKKDGEYLDPREYL